MNSAKVCSRGVMGILLASVLCLAGAIPALAAKGQGKQKDAGGAKGQDKQKDAGGDKGQNKQQNARGGRGQHGQKHHRNRGASQSHEENYWTITAVDPAANTLSATQDSGDTKTFRTNPQTAVLINGAAEQLTSLTVGMKAKFELFGTETLTQIEVASGKGGDGSSAAAGKHKKK